MDYYCEPNREDLAKSVFPEALKSRYAWLEHEKGTWHFLTSLWADPGESTRRWSQKKHALDELTKEGWTIVGSYPEYPSIPRPACGGAWGYGLMRIGH